MELKLANIISNLLVLGFKSLIRDLEYFFSSAHFLLQNFRNLFPTKWISRCKKIQISNNTDPLRDASPDTNEQRMQDAEIIWMMNRLGMVGGLDHDGGDLLALFDEEEPSFEEIKETFGVFDVNKDGFIDAEELQRVLFSLGLKEGCCLDDCERMIKSCGGDGNGAIDFRGFLIFMEKCLC